MAGNTYKWLGGSGTGGDPNDAALPANWLIDSGGTFIPATTTPGTGDTALFAGGTADILLSSPGTINAVALVLDGTNPVVNFANVTLDHFTTITDTAATLGQINVGAGVVNEGTIFVTGAGSTLDIAISGTLLNQSVALAQTGGGIAFTGGAGTTLTNQGGLVAFGGTVSVAQSLNGFGLDIVGSGAMTLDGAVSGNQSVIFANNTAELTIGDASQFGARLLGFETGDTIDLPGISFTSLKPLTINNNQLSVTDGANAASLNFSGSGFTSSQFVPFNDGHGGTGLTMTGVANPLWQASGGSLTGNWNNAAQWSTGTVPTAASFAEIANISGTPFIVTATNQTANGLVMLAPTGTLELGGSFTATRAIFQAVGLIEELAGGNVTAKTFNQVSGGAQLVMALGSQMTLSGGTAIPNNGNSALDVEGLAVLTGATLNAAAGSARIGWQNSGTMDVGAGSSVTANFTAIGASGTDSGTLTIDNSQWTDTPADLTAPFAGYMIVGGGDQGAAGPLSGGSGTLTLQNSATLTDTSGAFIAQSPASSGTVTITSGALWGVGGGLTVGNAAGGSGTLDMNGGTLAVAGTLSAFGSVDIAGGSSAAAANVALQFASLTLDNASLFTGGLNESNSILLVQNHATLSDFGSANLAGFGAFAPAVQTGGSLIVNGNLNVGSGASAFGPSASALNVTGGAATVGGTLEVAGTLNVSNGSTVHAAALLLNAGTLGVDTTSLLKIGAASAAGAAAGIVIAAGASATIGGGASVNSTLDVLGTLMTQGATIDTALTGSGTIGIASGTTLSVFGAAAAWTAAQVFGPGGGAELVLSGPSSNDQGTITGFGSVADTIDFPGVTFASLMPLTYNSATGALTLGGADGFSMLAQVDLQPGLALSVSKQQDLSGGTAAVVSVTPCYAAGTRIATPDGEAAVECLRPGDPVLVQDGAGWRVQPVRWVGSFGVNLARHPSPAQAAPIRICRNAFAANVPKRDLLLSPDHAVLVDGVLMQAQSLVNGATIRREPPAGRVTYYHVELERHGILLAEGLPAESYLDTGNRATFAAEAGVRPLFAYLSGARSWHADACAPLVLDGPAVAAAHARLLARAHALGHARTADPGLRVMADGREVLMAQAGPGSWRAMLPAGVTDLRLHSRSFVPAAFDPAATDRRRLGVAMASLRLGGKVLPASAYRSGWHPPEADWRWTDGDAILRLRKTARPAVLEICLVKAGPDYWAAAAA